jgi:anti-sigma regulatory factor (Ser/Thr protein kinase)
MECTSADGRGLAHHALLHPATADLAATLTPLVTERLTRGEPVLTVLPSNTAAGLRTRLPTLDGLHTTEPGGFYRHPGRVLSHYLAWIHDTRPDGRPVTIVAAPDLGSGGDAHRRALWMHIDAVTTVALAECDLTLVCVYPDDPSTADAVRRAHPSLLNGAVIPSPEHLPAHQFLASYPLPPPIELGEPDFTHTINHPTQLAGLRQIVAGHAARAGLPAARCADFVLAVTEIATNALEHGIPPAAIRLWITSTSVICQITDTGQYTQPLAGLLPPLVTQRRGRGLWMAHQLCDQFYLWPHPTTIRLHMDRPLQTVLPDSSGSATPR